MTLPSLNLIKCNLLNQWIVFIIIVSIATSCNNHDSEEAAATDSTVTIVDEFATDTSAFVTNSQEVRSPLMVYANDLNALCPQKWGSDEFTLQEVEASEKTITFHITVEPLFEEIYKKSIANAGGIGGSANQKSNLILGLIQDKSQMSLVNFLTENKCNISYIFSNINGDEIFQTTISSYDISETIQKLKAQGMEIKPI